ncbi:MAG: histidine phosphatase family protein [Clostridia bacterium]|nr:histidine phosphatase family protein [Clostridia bacterium]
MKLLIIRHADPDYSIDSLTPQGKIEAQALAEKLVDEKIDYFYCSPLGRAKDTAEYTLKKKGRKIDEIYDWLQEFPPQIQRPDCEHDKGTWDWLPSHWTKEEKFYLKDEWYNVDVMKGGNVKEEYLKVTNGFDALLEKHGYVRDGNIYRVEKANDDVLAIFCHFGLECVLLSHLIGASPMVLWHGFCAPPSSVTTVYTEERRKGIASFRISGFGDISHLYIKGEKPSFAARFCEMYDNFDERHD